MKEIIRESGSCGRSTPGSGNGLSKGPVVTAYMVARRSRRLVWLEQGEPAGKKAQAWREHWKDFAFGFYS